MGRSFILFRRNIVFATALANLAIFISLVTGCRTTQIRPAEESAIVQGSRPLVLFRATITDPKDTNRYAPLHAFRVRLAKIDPPQHARTMPTGYNDMTTGRRILAPTSASAEEGWRSLLLEPGSYFLELDYPTSQHLDYCHIPESARYAEGRIMGGLQTFGRYGQIVSNSFVPAPAFRLEIPTNQSVVYIGHFQLETSYERGSGFLDFKKARLNRAAVLDERARAQAIALERLPKLNPNDVVVQLATPFFDRPILQAHLPTIGTNIESFPSPQLEVDDVGSHAGTLYAGPIVWLGEFLSRDRGQLLTCPAGDSDPEDNDGDPLRFALGLAGAPFAAVANKVAGDRARKKWAPREAELKERLSSFQLERRLADSLNQRLAPLPRDASKVGTSSLEIHGLRTCLREFRRGQFGLEVAIRYRLRNSQAPSQPVLWEQILVASPLADSVEVRAGSLPFPFEGHVHTSLSTRPLSAYESPDGQDLLQADLEEAARAIDVTFSHLLGLPGS